MGCCEEAGVRFAIFPLRKGEQCDNLFTRTWDSMLLCTCILSRVSCWFDLCIITFPNGWHVLRFILSTQTIQTALSQRDFHPLKYDYKVNDVRSFGVGIWSGRVRSEFGLAVGFAVLQPCAAFVGVDFAL